MKRAFTNLIRRLCLAFLKKHPPESPEQMSLLLNTLRSGLRIKDIGVSISHLSLYPLKKKTGQQSEHGHGSTSTKSAASATSRTDGGTYRQAPYSECSEEEYNELKAKVPTINWENFKEVTDNVEGAQQLACSSGVCEI